MAKDKLCITWSEHDLFSWNELLMRAVQPNLLQSWAYGEAKAEAEGWTVYRGIIKNSKRKLGAVQALEKSWSFVGGVIRINRGPLWLDTIPKTDELFDAYATLLRSWQNRRRLVLIAPELRHTNEHVCMLRKLGLRPRKVRPWRSMWLDLRRSEEELRMSLKAKSWRRHLNAAERSTLQFVVTESKQDFDWLMARYNELMQIKDFKGPSLKLLTFLWQKNMPYDQIFIMKAMYEGKPVAGILVPCHGNTSSYLIGWNGPEGRKLRAFHFLIWHAIMDMKKRQCQWFDLGGIDDINMPGIARFKRGMNGTEYQLVGEYWAITL